jgi:hypothetical protein
MDKRMVVANKSLTFEGHPGDGKQLAIELRTMAMQAGVDMSTKLNDFVFGLEAEYQIVYGLHEDDWGLAPDDPYYEEVADGSP